MPREVLQGTLDLMVLRTLEAMGPQHGFGLAKRILQVSEGILDLNQGTLYPALLRLEQRGWIKSRWGVSESNRQAKFYELTARGRQIAAETENWARTESLEAEHRARGAILEAFCKPRKSMGTGACARNNQQQQRARRAFSCQCSSQKRRHSWGECTVPCAARCRRYAD